MYTAAVVFSKKDFEKSEELQDTHVFAIFSSLLLEKFILLCKDKCISEFGRKEPGGVALGQVLPASQCLVYDSGILF